MDLAVQHDTDAKKEVLENVRINILFFRASTGNRIEGWEVSANKFSLQDPGNFSGTFDLG